MPVGDIATDVARPNTRILYEESFRNSRMKKVSGQPKTKVRSFADLSSIMIMNFLLAILVNVALC